MDEVDRHARKRVVWALYVGVALLVVGAGVWSVDSLTGGGGDVDVAPVAAASVDASSAVTPPGPTSEVVTPSVIAVDAEAGARAFLQAWQAGDYATMQHLTADQNDDVAGAYQGMAARLGVTSVTVTPGTWSSATSSLPYQVTLTLDVVGPVTWSGAVTTSSEATVAWTADTLYPGLAAGQWLDRQPLPTRGEVVDRSGQPLAVDPDLAANLVGTVGTDGVGASGLQRAFDAELRGTGGEAVVVSNPTTGEVVRSVQEWPGPLPAPLATTLDLRVQQAATAALTGTGTRAALVAVDTGSGGVLAVANNPVAGLPAALAGQYPPGSTFKIITAAAALRAGLQPSSEVDCPQTLSAGGRTFKNAGGVPAGPTSLLRAFAVSCNTAFIALGRQVGTPALLDAAASFGFGSGQPLPVGSASGTVPDPDSDVMAAADAIGQGTVTASPLHMAAVAAAVAGGVWRQPHIVACPDCASHRIPEAGALQELMAEAVTAGTAAPAAAPGGAVYGKTGTAEVSAGGQHAWFVGWQGTVAVAVLVEFGGSGSEAAAPIAGRFFTLLGQR